MRKTTIERIIKQGSVRQKIKLYYTDLAYFNTVGQYKAKLIKEPGDSLKLDLKDRILTDKESDLIYNSITADKDIDYYNELRVWNRAFLMFKPTVTVYTQLFMYLAAKLRGYAVQRLLHGLYENTINEMLSVVEDKKLREQQVKIALKNLDTFQTKRLQDEDGFIEILDINTDGKTWELVAVINKEAKKAKNYIETIRRFLNKLLPLQPYKQFIKESEDTIKVYVKECQEYIRQISIGRDEDQRFNIIPWEDIEVEVTDEDIEDIKRAGL